MSQNQEIIEAKLCAYIDGELDPDGRSEIEKHLEANPQHRRLLESLRATRDLLRWLPREQAPPELSETLNGQLERSVLLDYEGDALRPRAWQRVFAAAAIVLLTAGLGVAVFYALPRSPKPSLAIHTQTSSDGDSGRRFAVDAPSIVAPAPESISTGAASDAEKKVDTLQKTPESGKEMAVSKGGVEQLKNESIAKAKSGEPDSKASLGVTASGGAVENVNRVGEIDQLVEEVAQNPEVFSSPANSPMPTSPARPMPPAPQNAMVMLVHSDAPQQAERQLTTYLDSRQIQWRQTQLPQQQRQTLNDQGVASNFTQNNQVVAQNKALPESQKDWRKDAAALSLNEKDKASKLDKMAAGGELDKQEISPGSATPLPAQTQPANTLADAVTSQATPVAAPAGQVFDGKVNGAANPVDHAPRQMDENAANNSSYHANGIYVVQMSRSQAALLCSTLSRDANQAAEVKDVTGPVNVNGAPAESSVLNMQPADGQAASRAAGLTALRPAEVPTTYPAERERINLRTAMATTAADAYSAQSADRTKMPTTQPSSPATDQRFGFATNASATTQSIEGNVSPTTGPADEPVNVVILIERNSAPAAATPPAQPAGIAGQQAGPSPTTQPVENAK